MGTFIHKLFCTYLMLVQKAYHISFLLILVTRLFVWISPCPTVPVTIATKLGRMVTNLERLLAMLLYPFITWSCEIL